MMFLALNMIRLKELLQNLILLLGENLVSNRYKRIRAGLQLIYI